MGTVTRYQQGNRNCVLTHYGSIADMEADCLNATFTRTDNGDQRRFLEQSRGRSWYGVDSLDEVKKILVEGYPAGAALVDQMYDEIAPSLPRAVDFRRKLTRADQGDELDIHAVNRGAIDRAWIVAKRKAGRGIGIIRVAVDICGNAYVNAEQLKWRGVAALALSRAMTKAGYSVEVVAGLAGKRAFASKPDMIGVVTVTVKPRHSAIDTATLAASICLPGFFRYLGFASVIRQADDVGCSVEGGLGQAVKLETVLPVPDRIAQVVVPETVNSREQAVSWVKESITMLQGATVGKETSR